MSTLCEALRVKLANYLTSNFYPDRPTSKAVVDEVFEIFRKVSEYVQWLTLAFSSFYVKRKQYKHP